MPFTAFTKNFTNNKKWHTSLRLLLTIKFEKRYKKFIVEFEQDFLIIEYLNNQLHVTLP